MTTRKGVQYPLRLWNLFQEFLHDDDAEDQALRFLFLNRCARFGRVILDPARRGRTDFTNSTGWSHGLFERLASASEVLEAARLPARTFRGCLMSRETMCWFTRILPACWTRC